METALAVAALMLVTWIVSLIAKDASIVDIIWGFGFVVIAWVAYVTVAEPGPRSVVLAVLPTLWGLRLTAYLARRNLGKGEDYRYATMRENHGNFSLWSLVFVFGLQGTLMWIVSAPVQFGMDGGALGVADYVGLAVFSVGFLFEAVGDWQLTRFKADPTTKGKVMRTGLWRYTRHPNYFGNFTLWWGIYLIAAAGGAWWTFYGPAIMSYLLLKVSGVAMLERTIADRRPEYAGYIATTNAFFPGPPEQ